MMEKFKKGDRVRFKNTTSEQLGTIIGFFEEDELGNNGEIVVYKGECKVKMDSSKEGSFTPASPRELESVS